MPFKLNNGKTKGSHFFHQQTCLEMVIFKIIHDSHVTWIKNQNFPHKGTTVGRFKQGSKYPAPPPFQLSTLTSYQHGQLLFLLFPELTLGCAGHYLGKKAKQHHPNNAVPYQVE